MGGGPAEINLGLLLVKRIQLIGTTLRSRPIEEKVTVSRRFAAEVLPWFDLGRMSPVIDRRFAFDDIAVAHEYLATDVSVGKVLIDVG